MGYRISLHLLATVWNILILVLSLSLKKSQISYRSVAYLSTFSILYSLFWALGLMFESDTFMSLTWIGVFMPAALLTFLWDQFDYRPRFLSRPIIWIFCGILFIGGLTPWCLKEVIQFTPQVLANYGWLEPILRIGMALIITTILWTLLRFFLIEGKNDRRKHALLYSGFLIYGVIGLLFTSLFPLFNDYRFLESASFGTVIWTTLAVWQTFRDLDQNNEQLSKLDLMKRDLINHVTHEFRTPLGAIQNSVDFLMQPEINTQKKSEYLTRISQNANRLEHFVNELLDYAAIQHGKVKFEKQTVDLFALCNTAVERIQPLISESKVELKVTGDSAAVTCDPDKIDQVITNLLSNAIKATPNGKIKISIQSTDQEVEFEIQDDGVGIEPSDLERIFSSFYQASTNISKKGSGLGLAIAKAVIEAHGGRIWAESEGKRKGAKIVFTLPKEKND